MLNVEEGVAELLMPRQIATPNLERLTKSPRHNGGGAEGDLPRLQRRKARATIPLRAAVQHNRATGHRYPSRRFDRDLETVGMGDGHRHHERGVSDRIDLKHAG